MTDTDARYSPKRRELGVDDGQNSEQLKAALVDLNKMSLAELRAAYKGAEKFKKRYAEVLIEMGLDPERDNLYKQYAVYQRHLEREGKARRGGLGEFERVI